MTNSYKNAGKSLHGIERKMNANSEFAKKYKTEIAKYFLKDYARELSTSEISDSSNLTPVCGTHSTQARQNANCL